MARNLLTRCHPGAAATQSRAPPRCPPTHHPPAAICLTALPPTSVPISRPSCCSCGPRRCLPGSGGPPAATNDSTHISSRNPQLETGWGRGRGMASCRRHELSLRLGVAGQLGRCGRSGRQASSSRRCSCTGAHLQRRLAHLNAGDAAAARHVLQGQAHVAPSCREAQRTGR